VDSSSRWFDGEDILARRCFERQEASRQDRRANAVLGLAHFHFLNSLSAFELTFNLKVQTP
jgi:hypothetical protein